MVMVIDERLVNNWFRRLIERGQRVVLDNNTIHVSEVSGCLRRAYYERLVPKATLDVRNIIMAIGNGIHYQLQDLLREDGWQSEVEVKYDFKKFKLVGHVDLYYPEEGIVAELKTTSKIPERPYDQHVIQVNAYLIMSKARKGYIIYIGKDGRVKVFNIRFDKKLWNQTVKRAFYLWHCLQEKRSPKPERSFLCNLCVYRWKCFKATPTASKTIVEGGRK